MDGFIAHHGVKGMKWGVRKDRKKSISVHRAKTIEVAKKSGMSQEEAEAYAARRALVQKALVVAGATTITAAAVYIAHNKYVKQHKGEILKSGSEMQRIVTKRRPDQVVEVPKIGTSMPDVPFYTSFTKGDNAVYKGLLNGEDSRFKLTLSPNTDIKVASVEASQGVFKKLYESDGDFRKTVDGMKFGHERTRGVGSKHDLRKTYAVFDHELVRSDPESRATSKKFYDAMKKAGYDAIYDLNDRDRERLAKKPVIVFNKMGNVKIKDVESFKLSDEMKKRTGLMQYLSNQITDGQKFRYSAEVGGSFIVGAGLMRKDDETDYYE